MKKIILLSIAAIFTLSGCGSNTNDVPPLAADSSIVQAQDHNNNGNNDFQIREITRRLRNIEYQYVSKLNPYDRDQATRELNQVYYLLNQLNNGNPNPGGYPMNDSDFSIFLSKVKAQPFQDDKINLISTATRSNWFSVDQITQVLKIFAFDDDKLNVLEIIYPKCADKNNGYRLLDLFAFSDSKEKARRIMEANPNPNQVAPLNTLKDDKTAKVPAKK